MTLHNPRVTLHVPDKEELFNKVLGSIDFKQCKNSLQAVRLMFDSMFTTLKGVVDDNETLIIDQAKQMKQFADLDEKYKLLKKESDAIRIYLQEKGIEIPEQAS